MRHFGGMFKSETLLNILLRIIEENKRLSDHSLSIDNGCDCIGEFFKTLLAKVFLRFT